MTDGVYQSTLKATRLLPITGILVTGPQRSGTTICARMLAQDLGWRYVDEDDVGWREANKNDEAKLLEVFTEEHVVVQAPACAYICHTLPRNIAVVFMMRKAEDIAASEARIGWTFRDAELAKYPEACHRGTVAETKYLYWQVQKPLIYHAFEIDYESLRGHPLWVEKEKRAAFAARQWRAE